MTWDETQLAAGYGALAARASSMDLADAVIDEIRRPGGPARHVGAWSWSTWLAVAAVVVLVAVGVGIATIPHSSGGPSDRGLKHFHGQGLDFDYPASWTMHDHLPPSTGFGQTWAIIGTQPWPASCGASDINCYYEAKLEPGTISVDVGVLGMPSTDVDLCTRGATGSDLVGRGPDDPVAHQSLTRVDGRPTLHTAYSVDGKDYYLSDAWDDWQIAASGTVDSAYEVNARYRGPNDDLFVHDIQAIIDTVRVTPGGLEGGPADCGAPWPSDGPPQPGPVASPTR